MERLSIEQVAAATGMTVRNIREHQTRGLLPPPELEGRKGWYDHRHVARLRLITELQAEGLNLQAIHWLLQRAPAETTGEIVRFERALFAPWSSETQTVLHSDELDELFGLEGSELRRRAAALDLIRPAGEERWLLVSPRLVEAGRELLEIGVPLEAALDVVAELRRHSDGIARTFVELFLTHVWAPFEAAGRPADGWEDVRAKLERLRPIATDAVLALFSRSMSDTIDATVAVQAEADGSRRSA